MWVQIHVFLPFFFAHFGSKIFHDGNRLVALTNLNNRPELTAMNLLSLKWRPQSNYNFEILALWWLWLTTSATSVLRGTDKRLIHLLRAWSVIISILTWPLRLLLVTLPSELLLAHINAHIHIHLFLYINLVKMLFIIY